MMENDVETEAVEQMEEKVVFRDRTTGLIVFGTVNILVGIFCFILAMLLMLGVSQSGPGGMKTSHLMISMGYFFFLTVWFCWMGLGSIKAQRWARALLLVGAWIGVFSGALALAALLLVLPEMYNVMADSEVISPLAALTALYFAVGVMVLIYLVFPVIGIVFYGGEHVQWTCEFRNPKPCWTDRCPLPLLAMSLVCILGCLTIFVASTTNYLAFLFGKVLSGWQGALVAGLVSVACGYVGWGAFRRRIAAWWLAYALVVLATASMMLTFAETDMESLYAHMNYSPEQIEQISGFYPFKPPVMIFVSCLWGVVACVYLVWVREMFRPEKDEVRSISYRQRREEEAEKEKKNEPSVRMRLE